MNSEKPKHKHRKDEPNVQISKNLSYLLRHGAIDEGLKIDKAGWVLLDEILAKKFYKSRKTTLKEIQEIVDTNSKKRFELKTEADASGKPAVYIRASQGHSIKIEDEGLLEKIEDPSKYPACLHGTYFKSWDIIKKDGLKTMTRNHIHFAPGYPGGTVISGMRATCTVFIDVDMEKAMKDGIEFFISKNNVILSRGINGMIPPKYFKKVTVNDKGDIRDIDPNEFASNASHQAVPKKVEEHKEQSQPQANGNKPNDVEEKKISDDKKAAKPEKNQSTEPYKYLCVLDFQAQCKKDKKLDVQEIIEFPVVIVDIEKKAILDERIHYFIKPVVHPELFDFCTELTGITQGQVNNGLVLMEALDELDAYLKHKGILDSNFVFVTCGDWDLFTCLKKEAKAKNIEVKDYLKSWINLRTYYPVPQESDVSKPELLGMLQMSKLEFIGKEHSGVDNANNLARVAVSLLEKGFNFTPKMTSTVRYCSLCATQLYNNMCI